MENTRIVQQLAKSTEEMSKTAAQRHEDQMAHFNGMMQSLGRIIRRQEEGEGGAKSISEVTALPSFEPQRKPEDGPQGRLGKSGGGAGRWQERENISSLQRGSAHATHPRILIFA